MENKFKEKIEALRNEIKSRQLSAEFADYFIAPFKGIGNGNINYYKRLEENLTDASRERSVCRPHATTSMALMLLFQMLMLHLIWTLRGLMLLFLKSIPRSRCRKDHEGPGWR